tara:strand:- start:58 stop:2016 length:1959 start_codon:yes stop_codon:yes gene_type:complete
MRYFDNDQTPHRVRNEHASGNLIGNQRLNNNITETENVVFANITTMVPALYARNPKAEFTSTNSKYEKLAVTLEHLVNTIMQKKAAPGINLKPKAKRAVVTALLTNRAWLQLNWTFKEDSSETALEDLENLAEKLQKTKSVKEVEKIEGEIMALEDSIDILQPAGPTLKWLSPFDVVVDPDSEEIDLGDAKWIMVRDFIPTSFLLARYATKKKGSGDEYQSIYQPSHVMKVNKDEDTGHEDPDTFNIFQQEHNAKDYGFSNEESFDKAKRTEVWFVWDKTTRRVMLFNNKDWSWPIWVWDDPLQLDRFFNVFGLMFFDSPEGSVTKGEVSYYLDQQDAINEMVDEERRARRWVRRNVLYNSNLVDRSDIEAVLSGDDGTARGLKLPEGTKLQEVVGTIPPPSMQFSELFDKEAKYQAIDKISSVGAVLRGEQFRTNTNTTSANITTSAQNMRVDEKSDAIEDWIGDIAWALAQLCLMNMDKETVLQMVGDEYGADWMNMSRNEIETILSFQVVGGSTKKPTSQAKKEEALELGQVLGQFVNAAPQAVVRIMIEVFQQAFDEITMKDDDWESLKQEMVQQQQAQQQQAQGQPPQGQAPQQGGQMDEGQLDQILAQLPTELKGQVAQQIQQGADPNQALQQAMAMMQQSGATQQ